MLRFTHKLTSKKIIWKKIYCLIVRDSLKIEMFIIITIIFNIFIIAEYLIEYKVENGLISFMKWTETKTFYTKCFTIVHIIVTVKCQFLNSNVIRIIETGICRYLHFQIFFTRLPIFFMKRSYNLNRIRI